MSFFSWGTRTSPVSLVLDIGNGSVGASLSLVHTHSKPEVLYSVRVPIALAEKPSAEQLELTLFQHLDACLGLIHVKGFAHTYFKNHPKEIDVVLCSFASPWFVSKTKDITIREERPFIVSRTFLDSVVAHEAEICKEELHSEGEGMFNEELDVVEKSITHVKINGYFIDNPIGQRTTEITASIYFGIIPKKIREGIELSIVKSLHVPKQHILFHTFPLISYTVLRDMFPKEEDYLLFDIAGETTDISLVRSGVLYETRTFPSARNFLLRHVASVVGVPIEVAKSYMRMYTEDTMISELRVQIKKALDDIETEWNIYLADALSNFTRQEVLPHKVFLTTDTDTASVFIHYLQAEKIDETSLWRKSIDIVHIEPKLLSAFVTTDPHVPCDEFLAIETVFLHKFRN